ncbi:hypothetical protein FNV43_RR11738 [Rhamnella rubrinervis]|uniref:CUE domain-containing protein n=1 Tax=Rhamnella rubrinervis TaxID=2594499 RepID=A0A8K0MI50_9ROSA|nr:hypothetical protein FNV43_RR11738 [Rhamnella rubrinervis]
MSHAHGKQAANKGLTKTQKIFVPKNHDQTQNRTSKLSSPSPTLSNSLRQSLPKQSDASTASSGAQSLASRVRKKENGDGVSNRARGGNFVNYLPQDEAVATGLSAEEGGLDPVESQRVVDLLNRGLSRLLKLNPREFWKEVASDTSLHEFLDSFLQFRSRWYDFPHHGAKGMVAGVIVGEFELSRRVFMVLYRISSNRDPGARAVDNLSPKDHGVILQEKKLLDLPKLLDICAIYGHENEDLTKILVTNALKAQPRIHNNLTSVMSHFLSIIHTMHQRCSSSVEVLCSSGSHVDHGSSHLCADMLEVMDFINDAIVSLDAFVNAYIPATVSFSSPVETSYGNEELVGTLAKLHDSLLPSLKRGFQMILTSEDGMVSNVAVGLKMLSMRIVNFGWKLLEFCYLSDKVFEDILPIPAATKVFPANVEDPVIRADILVQTFRQISEVSPCTELNQNNETFLQKVEQKFYILSKMENLRNTGWIFMDDEQLEYLSGIFKGSKKITTKGPNNAAMPVTSNKVHTDEDAAIMESKISQIKDLFPDYGQGFLGACLEAYNQNPEEVIQRILEGTLHEDLQTLDTSLETMPVPKTTVTVSRNDKGKGKLIEPGPLSFTNLVAAGRVQPNEGPIISSSSSLGRFVRKSKAETHDSDTLDNRNEKDSAVTAALLSNYEYEDEYDDSFDDLGLSVADSGLEENEILGDKVSSNVGKSWEKETENSSQIPASSKWGSRKKPQYYVRDGKNYSYKVAGAVAVANATEASIVTQAQEELIYGLGRGGNLPLGAVKKLMEASEQIDKQPADVCAETEVRGSGNPRGRGRRGGFGRQRDSNVEQEKESGGVSEVEQGRENMGNQRGRGRRGGGGGRNYNHYKKDRSMNKHFAGLSGY